MAVIGNAASCSSKGETGADNNREAYLLAGGFCLVNSMNNRTFRNLEADLVHGLTEGVSAFCFFDDINVSTKQFYIIFVENA